MFFSQDHVEDLFQIGGGELGSQERPISITRSNLKGKFIGGKECHQIKNDFLEKKCYKSAQNELGRSFNRGYILPDFTKDENFRFGIKTVKTDYLIDKVNQKDINEFGQAQDSENDINQPRIFQNYIKSHRSYLPGQQKTRNYNWPVDPLTTVFGDKGIDITKRSSSKGVSEALNHAHVEEKKDIEKEGTLHDQKTSRKKNWKSNLDTNQIFGKRTVSNNDESAADCLKSDHNFTGNEDDDLGKAVRPGFRNAITEKRSFGCPSVRSDIPQYSRHSVADTQNYGTDVNAEYLLRPSLYSSLGLEKDEFLKKRSKKYVKTLFEDTGYEIEEEDFNSVWKDNCDENGLMSIEGCRHVWRALSVYNSEGKVVPIEKFAAMVLDKDRRGMIQFYQPWSGESQRMIPEWKRLEQEYPPDHPSVFILRMNCDEDHDLEFCKLKNILHYPTILYYKSGEEFEYTGGKSFHHMNEFVKDTLEIPCDFLNKRDFTCSEKAQDYFFKWRAKKRKSGGSPDIVNKEIERLTKTVRDSKESLTSGARIWMNERISLLQQLLKYDKMREKQDKEKQKKIEEAAKEQEREKSKFEDEEIIEL